MSVWPEEDQGVYTTEKWRSPVSVPDKGDGCYNKESDRCADRGIVGGLREGLSRMYIKEVSSEGTGVLELIWEEDNKREFRGTGKGSFVDNK